jgi:hypothetical protein
MFGDGSALAILTSITSASNVIPKTFRKLRPLCSLLLSVSLIFNLGSGYYIKK